MPSRTTSTRVSWSESARPSSARSCASRSPTSHRERLTLPKLLLNAAGDQFFLPDSSRFYFDDLPGEKSLALRPKCGPLARQERRDGDARGVLRIDRRWVAAAAHQVDVRAGRSIKVVSKERPQEVKVWEAVNPTARNFRLDVIGPAYKSQVLTPVGPNTWVAHLRAPRHGWSAAFVELTFPTTGRYPLKVTTAVRILPDTLPFPGLRRTGHPALRRPCAERVSLSSSIWAC